MKDLIFQRREILRFAQNDKKFIDEILADLRHLSGESAIIESEYYQELDRQGTDKFRPVISLCKPEGLV